MIRRACQRFEPQMAAAVDAGGVFDLALQRHLRSCPNCRRKLQQYRRLRGTMRTLAPQVPIPTDDQPGQPKRDRWILPAAGGLSVAGLLLMTAVQQTRRKR